MTSNAAAQRFPYFIEGQITLIAAADQPAAAAVVQGLLEARRRERDRDSKWPLTPDGAVDTRLAMAALARRFPSLAAGVPGIEPWDAPALLRWVVLGGQSHCEALAAKFVLGVWANVDWQEQANDDGELLEEYRRLRGDPEAKIVLTKFNVFEALTRWDHAHRDAMLYFLLNPFQP